jgi:imidazole glycerol-phosphate synthase subunit HisH
MSLKKVGIIDYGCGNLASVINAIKYLKYDVEIIKKNNNLEHFSHLILPGVGSFRAGMEKLKSESWDTALKNYVEAKGKLLGICLGMQLLFNFGEEDGQTEGLNFFKGKCIKLNTYSKFPLPHIGFNSVSHNNSSIWSEIKNDSFFYFVHSYAIKELEEKYDCGTTNYSEKFISYIENGSVFGAQFHPEKSHLAGLKFIKNFIEQ